MALVQTNCVTQHFVASFFPFLQEKSAPMDRLRQRRAIRSTIVLLQDCCALIHRIIFHGTECSALAVRSNFAMMLQSSREHA
jgi:hypothetical protein